MTNLRTKMKEEMILVGLAASTQAIYLKSVVNLHEYYKKSPAKLSEKEIRQYLLYLLQEKKLAPNTYNTHIYALRFFYCITLRKPLHKLELPTTKVIYKLPSILSLEEVQRIIKATSNIKHRALLMVIYGAGLRVSEALNLRMEDIDSERMTLHIRDCKNRKERYVIFSPAVQKILREYWKSSRFTNYIFTGQKISKPLTTSSASEVFKTAKAVAGIKKPGGIHSLRHAFATHLLESGAELYAIKSLLGHSSIHSTVRYLEFVPARHKNIRSPIEQLAL